MSTSKGAIAFDDGRKILATPVVVTQSRPVLSEQEFQEYYELSKTVELINANGFKTVRC